MTYMRRYNGRSINGKNGKNGSTVYEALGGITDILGTVTSAIGGIVSLGTESFLKLAAPHYKVVTGVAKATDSLTLDLFKALQNQLNRVAKQKNLKVIAIDGAIGPGTQALAAAVTGAAAADYNTWSKVQTTTAPITDASWGAAQLAQVSQLIATPSSTPDEIAANALTLYSTVKAYADRLAAPPAVSSPPPAQAPTYIDISSNKEVGQGMAASASDAWKRLGTGTQIATIGALGLAGFYFYRESKKGSRRSSSRSRR